MIVKNVTKARIVKTAANSPRVLCIVYHPRGLTNFFRLKVIHNYCKLCRRPPRGNQPQPIHGAATRVVPGWAVGGVARPVFSLHVFARHQSTPYDNSNDRGDATDHTSTGARALPVSLHRSAPEQEGHHQSRYHRYPK